MTFRIGKLTFKTIGGLRRALEREGAKHVRVGPSLVTVEWDNGNSCEYRMSPDGTLEDQLRWDFRRKGGVV